MAYGQEGFSSGDEARAAWQQYREQIMADLSCAGRQPAAFYRFDLNINVPRRWYDELIVLLDKRLISAEEAVRIEASNQMLSGEHQEAFCAAFDDAGAIIQMRLDADGAGTLVKKFEAAARWHQWRGRPEVAERYTARADLLRAWMGDGNLSRGFNYDGNHYSA